MILLTITAIGGAAYVFAHVFLKRQYKRTDLDYSDNLFDETDIYDGE